jgi:hypothetical protein
VVLVTVVALVVVAAAAAGTPLVQAMPNSSAIALNIPSSALGRLPCVRSLIYTLPSDTGRYWDEMFIVL